MLLNITCAYKQVAETKQNEPSFITNERNISVVVGLILNADELHAVNASLNNYTTVIYLYLRRALRPVVGITKS